MSNNKIIFFMIISVILMLSDLPIGLAEDAPAGQVRKKRDPFVALLKSDGNIKSLDELSPSDKPTPTGPVNLTAIIWDEQRPLVLINKKVYSEGQEISKGLKVEKIFQNSVQLNNQGVLVTIGLRKTEKEWIK